MCGWGDVVYDWEEGGFGKGGYVYQVMRCGLFLCRGDGVEVSLLLSKFFSVDELGKGNNASR